MLGVPETDKRQGSLEMHSLFIFRRNRVKSGNVAVCVVDRHFDLGMLRKRAERKLGVNRSALILAVGQSRNGKIGDILRSGRIKIDASENSGKAKKILILKPASRTPAVNLNAYGVFAGL